MPPTLEELKDKYLVQPTDVPASDWAPSIHDGCRITTLVDPKAYFDALKIELANVGRGETPASNQDDFVYIVSWYPELAAEWTEPPLPFSLDGPGGVPLADVLKEKVARGVDVRMIADVNQTFMSFHKHWHKHPRLRALLGPHVTTIEGQLGRAAQWERIMETVEHLRARGIKCCLNTTGHAAGGTHNKLVILGYRESPTADITAIGFTGGVDFVFDRYDSVSHSTPRPYNQAVGWHDVTAKVEGPVVTALYQDFQLMWNEILERRAKTYRYKEHVPETVIEEDGLVVTIPGLPPYYGSCRSVVDGTDSVRNRPLSTQSRGTHAVQSLRTVPAANYTGFFGFIARRAGAKALSYAPNGLFTCELAWQKAIAAAERYIYMEDWGYWSEDVMVWINDVIKRKPNLRVIFMHGHDVPDGDPYPPLLVLASWRLLFDLEPEQIEQIRFYRHRDIQVHSKTTLIDDHWTIIGSTNCNRRSLYTDFEHSVGVVAADGLVRNYRKDLWADHFRGPCPDSIEEALERWFGTGTLPPNVVRFPLVPRPPLMRSTSTGEEEVPPAERPATTAALRKMADLATDPDSRKPWGDFSLKDLPG